MTLTLPGHRKVEVGHLYAWSGPHRLCASPRSNEAHLGGELRKPYPLDKAVASVRRVQGTGPSPFGAPFIAGHLNGGKAVRASCLSLAPTDILGWPDTPTRLSRIGRRSSFENHTKRFLLPKM